jgi:putative phosphoesterase
VSKKIVIFSDLHSNIEALTTVVENEENVDQWICLGDFVGLFPGVNETINLLRELGAICVLGDHELALLSGEDLPQSFSASESLRSQRQEIYKENRLFLEDLELELTLDVGTSRVKIVHDLNNNTGEKYLFDYDLISRQTEEGVCKILFGNTHLPTYHVGKSVTFLNPGSLGFPVQRNPKPSYVVTDENLENPVFKEISVNQQDTLRMLRSKNYNDAFIKYLERGYVWPKNS